MGATPVDVRGLTCSDAVVRLHKAITPLSAGAVLKVLADDWAVLIDLKKYADRGGHAWVKEQKRPSGEYEVEVKRGA